MITYILFYLVYPKLVFNKVNLKHLYASSVRVFFYTNEYLFIGVHGVSSLNVNTLRVDCKNYVRSLTNTVTNISLYIATPPPIPHKKCVLRIAIQLLTSNYAYKIIGL